MAVVPREEPATLLTVCEHGYGKRTPTSDYPTKNRGGKGVITIKTTERNGKVVGLRIVTDDDDLMLITDGGKLIRMPVDGIPTIGRNTQGVRLIRLEEAREGGRDGAAGREGRGRARGLARGGGRPRRARQTAGRGRSGRRERRRTSDDEGEGEDDDEGGDDDERRRASTAATKLDDGDQPRFQAPALLEPVRTRAVAVPRRGQLAGARLQGGGRHAGVPRPRRRARTSGTPTATATSTSSARGGR